jgi:hypothetical protein
MSAFIEVHPRNVFQGLLLVNVDDIKCVYRVTSGNNQLSTVLRFQGADSKPLDVEESCEEIKRLISQALPLQPFPQGVGFALSTAALSADNGDKTGRRQLGRGSGRGVTSRLRGAGSEIST